MKRFATVAVSAVVIAVMIGVYVNQSPQNTQNAQQASSIEPAAGQQQTPSDAVEESIKRIEKTMQEMEEQNNERNAQEQDDNPGDQSANTTEAPGIQNLNAPNEPTGDGMTEIIHAESMQNDDSTSTGDAAEDVQQIEPAAGDVDTSSDESGMNQETQDRQ